MKSTDMKPPHFRHCRYEVDGPVVTITILPPLSAGK